MPEYKQPWEILIENALTWEYGSIHTHDEIWDIIGVEANYFPTIAKANKKLLEKGKKLVSVHKIGYKVLEPENYVSHSTDIFKQGRKRIRKAIKIMNYAPVNLMSLEARQLHQNILDRMVFYEGTLKGGCKLITTLQAPKQVNSVSNERFNPNIAQETKEEKVIVQEVL